ncbi:tRNA glutamyl-Q(34) synthetase GluQRS [Providencia stuartii]|uniref:Glutamyl-Q tRNA(Asp) synthetase n=1 Tax=Providencia stuartii TaxID=588 RepID=A0A1S1HS93_PROST|nr:MULTISPECIES: tRNA glutamyl-Q(34) synthetase GluQRS [Providencia]ELR5299559.1 tRNA glutamyl-Q(34) synthetase GluQRS [Providencia stuartii]MDW7588670.1 tRNA glutamyl-Q(34) synthetase GluQRS [Providencia sp. 2023EL-00965]OHT24193.1 tRNA glutamyl-Q synthetase [Providencia stuartii]
MKSTTSPYIGRFAPSPSGNLHLGSLVTALGSYLQARSQNGKWLVRIDDIDPPREVAGASQRILTTLEHYGLYWDDHVLYQSQRHDAYREALEYLHQQGKSYYCTCSRHRIKELQGHYDGHCRHLQLPALDAAIRLKQTHPVYQFTDKIRGTVYTEANVAEEDVIIHRKDGLFAYNLVVVVDDHYQNVTEVVRGADLIPATLQQISLYHHLSLPIPRYAHLPLILNHDNNKLSKQNHATALPMTDPRPVICHALALLKQPPIAHWQDLNTHQLLEIATRQWQLAVIPSHDIIDKTYD